MYKEKYFIKDRYVRFSTRFGAWKANDCAYEIKDKIHILPFLYFYFNSYEMGVGLGWLNFSSFFQYIDFKRKQRYIK